MIGATADMHRVIAAAYASPDATPLVSVITLATAQTDSFIAAWDALAQVASEPNPFYESWYLLPSLKGWGEDVKLLAVEHAGQLIAILPIHHLNRYGRWPIAHMTNWLHPNIFFGAPLVRTGSEEAFWEALYAHADSQAGTALFLHIEGLPQGGVLQRALEYVCAKQGRLHGLVNLVERAFLKSDLEPEAYFAHAVRGKKRKELRRQKNRLSEMGALSFERSDGLYGLDQWVEDFLKLEAAGWKGKAGSALASAQHTQNLFKQALVGAAHRGRLELLQYRFDGQPLAMLVNFLTAPGSYSYKTAFDEDYARYSPGVLLQEENLTLLQKDGIGWCDSCAAQGHPMIDSIWRERRAIGRHSIAIGGIGRRMLFRILLAAEMRRIDTISPSNQDDISTQDAES